MTAFVLDCLWAWNVRQLIGYSLRWRADVLEAIYVQSHLSWCVLVKRSKVNQVGCGV